MKKCTPGERIKALRMAHKLNQMQLAKAVGVSNVAISQWERAETEPKGGNLSALASALGCSSDYILYGGEQENNVAMVSRYLPNSKYPLISKIQAGCWSEACEPYNIKAIDQWLESDVHIQGKAFWLMVDGDSMTSPVGVTIPEGTFVLFDTGREAINGSLVIAKLSDSNEATFKKLVIDGNQRYLRGLNPTWPVMQINSQCRIIGVAVEAKTKLI